MANPSTPQADEDKGSFRSTLIIIVIAIVAMTVGLVVVGVLLVRSSTEPATASGVQMVRDLFIILLALELVVIGAAFTVLLLQIARFVNLLSNEIDPILKTTSDTVHTVHGTVIFINKNLTDPLIKTSSVVAGMRRITKDATFLKGILSGLSAAIVVEEETKESENKGDNTPPEEHPEPKKENKDNGE
jgi:flagellar basal body-associated protein FliL